MYRGSSKKHALLGSIKMHFVQGRGQSTIEVAADTTKAHEELRRASPASQPARTTISFVQGVLQYCC